MNRSQELCVLLHDTTSQQVDGYFILLPSSSSTMLLKSIAVRELMMPHDNTPVVSSTSEDVNQHVHTVLSKVCVSEYVCECVSDCVCVCVWTLIGG